MPEGVLEIDRISKRYGEVVALRDMSFDVRAGELFGFVLNEMRERPRE